MPPALFFFRIVLRIQGLLWAHLGFLGGSDSKESTCNAGDLGSIPGSERSPGEGNGYPLQYSCLKIPMYREPGRLTVHVGTRGLSTHTFSSIQSLSCLRLFVTP